MPVDLLGRLPSLPMEEDFPEVRWIIGDDLCDCTFQRIGWWTNPYLGETLEVRLCCIWEEIYKQFPEHVRRIPGYFNDNTGRFEAGTRTWDSDEADMPVSFWFRQLARRTGRSLESIRQEYRGREHERPKKVAQREEVRVDPKQLAEARRRMLRDSGWLTEREYRNG